MLVLMTARSTPDVHQTPSNKANRLTSILSKLLGLVTVMWPMLSNGFLPNTASQTHMYGDNQFELVRGWWQHSLTYTPASFHSKTQLPPVPVIRPSWVQPHCSSLCEENSPYSCITSTLNETEATHSCVLHGLCVVQFYGKVYPVKCC